MKVRIGVLETDKLLEVDVDDLAAFKDEMEKALKDGTMAWFTDTKGRSVGIPANNVAFIEVEDADKGPQVGFAPAV